MSDKSFTKHSYNSTSKLMTSISKNHHIYGRVKSLVNGPRNGISHTKGNKKKSIKTRRPKKIK